MKKKLKEMKEDVEYYEADHANLRKGLKNIQNVNKEYNTAVSFKPLGVILLLNYTQIFILFDLWNN